MLKTLKSTQQTRAASLKRAPINELYTLDLDSLENKVMPLEEFLLHFYRILIEFVNCEDELPKVFNLYVIRTKMVKNEVDVFKKLYNNSLVHFRIENSEVSHLVGLLKHNDKQALDFFIAGKQVLLRFYNLSPKKLSISLLDLKIKISEWMSVLKSFWFFGNTRQTEKLDEFVKNVLSLSENYLTLNGVDFLIAVNNFYLKLQVQQKIETSQNQERQTLTFAKSERSKRPIIVSEFQVSKEFENKELKIGKSAQKFSQKAEIILPIKQERKEHCNIKSDK